MTISLTQAILLGLFCGIAKCCIPYTGEYPKVCVNLQTDVR